MFPETYKWYLTSEHRELRDNAKRLRESFKTFMKEKKKEMLNPSFED
jgi:hypothetical protein